MDSALGIIPGPSCDLGDFPSDRNHTLVPHRFLRPLKELTIDYESPTAGSREEFRVVVALPVGRYRLPVQKLAV